MVHYAFLPSRICQFDSDYSLILSDDVMVSITDFDSVCLGSSPGRITNQRVTQVGEGVTLLT